MSRKSFAVKSAAKCSQINLIYANIGRLILEKNPSNVHNVTKDSLGGDLSEDTNVLFTGEKNPSSAHNVTNGFLKKEILEHMNVVGTLEKNPTIAHNVTGGSVICHV